MLTRRSLIQKGIGFGMYSVMGTFGILSLNGCNEDQIIDGLKVALQVSNAAKSIIDPTNPQIGNFLGNLSKDLTTIIKTYNDYETNVADRPGKLVLIQATASAISVNLAAILEEAHVKNPELITYISVTVAIVNSAITVLINSLPQPTVTQAVTVGKQVQTLPVLKNARKASDLKNAWNNIVKMEHPEAVIK